MQKKLIHYLLSGKLFYLLFFLQALVGSIFVFIEPSPLEITNNKEPIRQVLGLQFVSKTKDITKSDIGKQIPNQKTAMNDSNSARSGEVTEDITQAYLSNIRQRIERNKRYPRREKALR